MIDFEAGQRYTTTGGNEYVVDFIARESGNIVDLFVVYNKISKEQDGVQSRFFLKKTTDLKSADSFDEQTSTDTALETTMGESEDLDISIGQKYQHFKTNDFYIIKAIAHDPVKPKNRFVIYEGQYDSPDFGHNPIWVREIGDFTGMKTFGENELDENGQPKAPVKRFKLIE